MKFRFEIRGKMSGHKVKELEFSVPAFFADDSKALADEAWNTACEDKGFDPKFHVLTAPVAVTERT